MSWALSTENRFIINLWTKNFITLSQDVSEEFDNKHETREFCILDIDIYGCCFRKQSRGPRAVYVIREAVHYKVQAESTEMQFI